MDERVDTRLRRALKLNQFPKELLIAGPAGTGKTYPILAFLHVLNSEVPNLRGLFLRAFRSDLTDSVLQTFEERVLPADEDMDVVDVRGVRTKWEGARISEGSRRNQRASYEYPNGSSIACRGVDRNATSILSTAWDWVFVNESIQVKHEVWETLSSRMRRPDRDSRFGWIIGDTNPASPDHYLMHRVRAGKLALWETTHKANPLSWGRVTNDWTDAGRDYLEQLGNLTGVRRKRLLQGLWVGGEGTWFDTFDASVHLGSVEPDPNLPVYVSVDSGVCTAAVIFQLVEGNTKVNVLADFYAERQRADDNARAILRVADTVAGGCRYRVVSTDSAGDAANPGGGPVITAEYERAGLKSSDGNLHRWPKFPGCIADGLSLIEVFVGGTEDHPPALTIHPRCSWLKAAFENYERASRAGQWMDYPKDPQHPHEDLIDALRGGLKVALPEGRKPQPRFNRVHWGRVF